MTDIPTLDALGDSTRRQLLELLREGPCSVNELAAHLPISQPAVSQHLKVLREAHLVRVNKNGNRRIYTIDPVGLESLRTYIENLWSDVLGAYTKAAEKISQEEEQHGSI
jgi:DNA-binding transcriptional ArsR family regulator